MGGLPEAPARKIAAMAGKVRGIVQVEHLADERQTPALLKHELPTQAANQAIENCRQTSNAPAASTWGIGAAFAVELAGVGLVELGDEASPGRHAPDRG